MTLFFGKTITPQNGLLIFLGKRDTFRNKIMEIVEDFDEKSYNNNGKPWKSSRILRVNPIFVFFFLFSSLFSIFSFFFSFFHFFIFSHLFHFFHFLHFPPFSFIFFHFLSFSLLGAQNLFFLGLNFVTISLDSSYVKNQFLGPSRVVLFLFFLLVFLPFFVFFLAYYFFIFSFFVHFFIF